jgi:cation diffusion facilitator CzcD-associated flavoprotein CzcO
MLELDVWCGTTFKGAEYDTSSGRWTVETLTTDGRVRIVHPKHLVWAGSPFFGPQPYFTSLPNYKNFEGISYYASEHHSAFDIPNIKNKKVVVVGSNTTAHDICQDFVNAGAASVTMIQRSSTIVHTIDGAIQTLLKPPPEGMDIEDSRFTQQSMPLPVQLEMVSLASRIMVQFDKQLLDSLDTTEFVASKCENGDNFLRRALGSRGGGYYVDHGASELIASRVIKVAFCPKGVEKLNAHGLVLADGRVLEADVIVAATGFQRIEDHLAEVVGEKVASCATELHRGTETTDNESVEGIDRLWKGIYKSTGHPGFWMALGILQFTLPDAEALALRIIAAEGGLLKA